MKLLYLFHVISLILLLFIGYSFIAELRSILENPPVGEELITNWDLMIHRTRSRFLVRFYGICSLFIFAFSVFVGWKMIAKLEKTGGLLLLGSLSGLLGTILMIKSPDDILLERVFPAWAIYAVIAICLSIYGALKYEKTPDIRTYSKDEILDDGMNE
jgi:hypothetical protein